MAPATTICTHASRRYVYGGAICYWGTSTFHIFWLGALMTTQGRMMKYMGLPPNRKPIFKVGDAVRPVPGAKTLTDPTILDGESYGIIALVFDRIIHVDDDLNGRIHLAPEDLILIKSVGDR